MKKMLIAIDNEFTSQYRGLLEIQRNIQHQLISYEFDLSKTEITDVIIERMLAFWYFKVNNNKELLNREINTQSADFFTETCLLFFKGYFEQNEGIKVVSEMKISKNPDIRPDISILKNDNPVAVIELKVSNGWKGKTIYSHLEEREKQIKELYPNVYFGVMAFWNFFETTTDKWNTKYFGLLNYDKDNNHTRTDSNIEQLLEKINKHL